MNTWVARTNAKEACYRGISRDVRKFIHDYRSQIQFTCFPNLPIELREMIWKHTLEPRVLEIRYEAFKYEDKFWEFEVDEVDDQGKPHRNRGFYTATRTPLALQICHDSRNAVLQSYPQCFGSIWYPERIRFNISIDTLYLGFCDWRHIQTFFNLLSVYERDSLRYLAFDECQFNDGGTGSMILRPTFFERLKYAMESLKNLKAFFVLENIYESITRIRTHEEQEEEEHALWILHRKGSADTEIHESVPAVFGKDFGDIHDEYPQSIKAWKVKSRFAFAWSKDKTYFPPMTRDKLLSDTSKLLDYVSSILDRNLSQILKEIRADCDKEGPSPDDITNEKLKQLVHKIRRYLCELDENLSNILSNPKSSYAA